MKLSKDLIAQHNLTDEEYKKIMERLYLGAYNGSRRAS